MKFSKQIALLALSLLILFDLQAEYLAPNNKAKLIKVIDGDTILVELNSTKETVRLIGIDAPESQPNEKAAFIAKRFRQKMSIGLEHGKEATKYLKSILDKGSILTLQFDVQERDKYNRLLAYAYDKDMQMLNELIIGSGYAYPLTIPPNVKFQDLFLRKFKEARNKKLGLWQNGEWHG
jgi:micrococcal nuclease